MTYINNQYLKLDKSIEEIAKLKVCVNIDNNELIEDLDIIEDESNIIIAYGYLVF